ncbi:MAG: hypothetical protein JWO20_1855 [Candidatus Angelobacter sp.]|jgi:hypothetical protein|nr:hypothetical protein [Candidatus Angelobacter sp.]
MRWTVRKPIYGNYVHRLLQHYYPKYGSEAIRSLTSVRSAIARLPFRLSSANVALRPEFTKSDYHSPSQIGSKKGQPPSTGGIIPPERHAHLRPAQARGAGV